jgi:hypothetical protein
MLEFFNMVDQSLDISGSRFISTVLGSHQISVLLRLQIGNRM